MPVIESILVNHFAGHSVMAYVGPGLGTGALALLLGFLGSIVLALFAVLWYPIKRLIKKMNNTKTDTHTNP